MKAKKIVALLVPLLALASCDLSGIFGVGPEDSKKTENQTNELVKALYEEYLANGGKLSYEEWLQVLKGEKTEVEKGLDGITPHIGDNGNWWIGGSDTGIHAQGSQGEKGEKGDKGDTGSQGIQGEKGETGSVGPQGPAGSDGQNGSNGLTPVIGDNGNWWIGGSDTGIHAQGSQGNQGEKGDKGDKGDAGATGSQGIQGEKGETGSVGPQGPAGSDGQDGSNGITPHIGDNGNWWIGDTDTGVHAQGSQGEKGEKGDKGDTGSQGIQGEQGVQGEKGETGEQGEQGEKGEDGVSIVNAYVDSKFHLILILSNGAVIDCGFIGAPGTEVFDTFTVTFKDCDGKVLKEETVISGDSATAPSVPSRNGYVFTGWDKSFANVAENIQVTAQFEKLYSRPTIAVESVSASAGDEGLAINIDVFNSPGVCTIFSKLSFNTAALTLKNVTFNSSLGGMASTSQTGSYTSPVRLNWSNPLNDYDGDFTFATLIFDVNGGLTAGDYDLTYSYNSSDVFNLNEDDVSFDIVSGVVSII